jgi:hypothetical protein
MNDESGIKRLLYPRLRVFLTPHAFIILNSSFCIHYSASRAASAVTVKNND